MKRCKTAKAQEIEKILEERTGEHVQIRKGAPDARYRNGYYAYLTTNNGFAINQTYGDLYASSETLSGLLSLEANKFSLMNKRK